MRYKYLLCFFMVFSVHGANTCEPNGCNGELCTLKDEPVMSTCLWKAEYACYKQFGICEADANGICGWKQTPELLACLKQAQYNVDRADPFSD